MGSEKTTIIWTPMEAVDIRGHGGETLNRRIATHLKLRADYDAGEVKEFKMRAKENPLMEILRREIFIWHDLIKLKRLKGIEFAAEQAALESVTSAYKELL